LRIYNKWVKSGVIPEDRTYVVLIPITSSTPLSLASSIAEASRASRVEPSYSSSASVSKNVKGKINGIPTLQALAGENAAKLAARAGVDLSDFLRWNDLSIGQPIVPGVHYFLGKKRSRATEAYHKVQKGESLWAVSQQYGIKLKKLKKYNRLQKDDVAPGTTLWLASMMPKSARSNGSVANAVVVEKEETFNWAVTPESTPAEVQSEEIAIVEKVPLIPLSPETGEEMAEPGITDSTKNLPVLSGAEITSDTLTSIPVIVQETKKTEHVVQAGETLYGIARIYSIGVMDLVNWNGLDLQQGIKPGQIIKLSDDQPMAHAVITPKEILHEVQASDTLFSIARKYGVTIKELMDWNGKKDFTLAVGEKLKVIQGQ
jgi:membrane-bound lytic murein transglycosylase D